MISSRGMAIAAVAVTAVLLSGCGGTGGTGLFTYTPPPMTGFVSCAPTYPGWYVWPPHNACYPANGGFYTWWYVAK